MDIKVEDLPDFDIDNDFLDQFLSTLSLDISTHDVTETLNTLENSHSEDTSNQPQVNSISSELPTAESSNESRYTPSFEKISSCTDDDLSVDPIDFLFDKSKWRNKEYDYDEDKDDDSEDELFERDPERNRSRQKRRPEPYTAHNHPHHSLHRSEKQVITNSLKDSLESQSYGTVSDHENKCTEIPCEVSVDAMDDILSKIGDLAISMGCGLVIDEGLTGVPSLKDSKDPADYINKIKQYLEQGSEIVDHVSVSEVDAFNIPDIDVEPGACASEFDNSGFLPSDENILNGKTIALDLKSNSFKSFDECSDLFTFLIPDDPSQKSESVLDMSSSSQSISQVPKKNREIRIKLKNSASTALKKSALFSKEKYNTEKKKLLRMINELERVNGERANKRLKIVHIVDEADTLKRTATDSKDSIKKHRQS